MLLIRIVIIMHAFEINIIFQWENHSRSMKLEAVTLDKIKNIITVRIFKLFQQLIKIPTKNL